ncbi:MAG: glutamate formimidoyltransferase [Deltaproteobacteria bacterium]|nr:glutamate formimidoyltransferase [Deltaproteobacteria bacterium]
MNRIVECVPNISEGRDREKIEKISNVLINRNGIKLLNVEPDADYNRTVITFVGEPEFVVDVGFEFFKTAIELIDMRIHKGEHPRMGAVDVFPFVPIKNVSMDECITLSKALAKRVGEELGIPVYLYEYSATTPQRKNLADIRKGEYEALPEKMRSPEWKPDYGPQEFVAKSGASVIGARQFLIAYNVNIYKDDLPTSVKVADFIAKNIRESGYKLPDGTRIPGKLKAVKAMGVELKQYNIAQVSMNLTDYNVTGMHTAYELIKKYADEEKAEVRGSEIVGLIPFDAFKKAALFYSSGSEMNQTDTINLVIEKLGLNSLYKFDPYSKILDLMV